MPDLNKMLDDVQKQSKDITRRLERLLGTYEDLYREGNSIYQRERLGSSDGLDDFHRLVQIVRRNRDVAGSLLRGVRNLRPISDFRFIEEDFEEVQDKEPEIDPGRLAEVKIPEAETVPETAGEDVDG